MARAMILLATLTIGSAGCEAKHASAKSPTASTAATLAESSPQARTEVPAPSKRLFLDEHDLGPGKVTAAAVAQAHRQDLAAEGQFGVDFKAYWLDEQQGKIHNT